MHGAVNVGHNRFVMADSDGLEMWDFASQTVLIWAPPKRKDVSQMFLWGGKFGVSTNSRFVAICGRSRLVSCAIYLLDCDAPGLLKFNVAPSFSTDVVVRFVSVSDETSPGARLMCFDPAKRRFERLDAVAEQGVNMAGDPWDAPTSELASGMPNSMPVRLQKREMPMIDTIQS